MSPAQANRPTRVGLVVEQCWQRVPGGSATYKLLRGRFALYNELVRESADRHGADVVDYWRLREYRDWGYWDPDRMHMNHAGHLRMAHEVLGVLGVAHDLPAPEPVVMPDRTRVETLRHHGTWTRDAALPWVHRRLTGRSSGDGRPAKRPDLLPYER